MAKRQTDVNFSTSVSVKFDPKNYMQLAGLGLYLDIDNYAFLAISYDEKVGRSITLLKAEKSEFSILTSPIAVKSEAVTLKADVTGITGTFSFIDGNHEVEINPKLDLSFLSGGFTGNFIALDTIDMGQYNRAKATFNSFDYQPK
ncbi:hypothetical protein L3V66_04140 [Secundilactobacillus sp. HBUAS58055]|nr:hypothetical protein [Secundilactobacillus angelensis]